MRDQRMSATALLALAILAGSASAQYHVGIGKADITGPVADVNLMGYAMPMQIAKGLHIRLFARAYLFASPEDTTKRLVFVSIDACMSSQLVTMRVLERLKAEYGGLYHEGNVAISGTHTHASPAGFLQYVLYDITSLGFVKQTFDAMVDGIMESIRAAHADVRPATVSWAAGDLLDANINRSPSAYAANPPEERAQYQHDVAKEMSVLRVADADGRGRGLLSWFAVHCTSLNNTNSLISGDNKGAAEVFTERWAASQQGWSQSFVAAFAQSSVGDTSPNTQGAFCLDTGEPCEMLHSTCNGRNELCHGRGPAWPNDAASAAIIGQRQASKAQELWAVPGGQVHGEIDYRHAFLDMRDIEVSASAWTREGRTCPAALGFSFAAGTTDGPGAFDFTQGDTNGTAFWKVVRDFISAPTQEQQACHAPKPILLDTGSITLPYAWQPSITEVSLLRIGTFVIVCVPGEFTTMAGRRMRRAVYETVKGKWGQDVKVVLAGLTNTYASYITTWEEYQVQRYEGAFTLYGPHTLDAYIQEVLKLAESMLAGTPLPPSSVRPPDLESVQISLLAPVVRDTVPFAAHFGDVVVDTQGVYRPGQVVEATFRSGCPRNNLRRNGTFLAVERLDAPSLSWVPVATDDDWETRFRWSRHWKLSSESYATISWDIPDDTPQGTYRLKHYGDWKPLLSSPRPFEGISAEFVVVHATSEYEQMKLAWHTAQENRRRHGGAMLIGADLHTGMLAHRLRHAGHSHRPHSAFRRTRIKPW